MTTTAHTSQLIVPPPLRQGSRIELVSPSGAVEQAHVTGAAKVLSQWGYSPELGAHCLDSYADYGGLMPLGGTDAHRLADLKAALDEPLTRAVLCSRGGYGALRLIHHLDTAAIKARPKWVIGFSDITALHALIHHAGMMSVHGPMAKYLATHGAEDEAAKALHGILDGTRWPCYTLPPHQCNRHGQARATMLGGNLAVLTALVSTPYNMIEPGCILFIENVGHSVSRVERMLITLDMAGILPQLAGLAVGQLSTVSAQEQEALEQMVARMTAPYDYPVAFGLPVGHVGPNMPLVEGAPTTLHVTASGAVLEQHRPDF